MNAKPSKRWSDQVFKMSSTSFYTSSSVKNMKSTADVGKRRSRFRVRVWRKAQFATASSCARCSFKFWRMIQYTEEWWIPVSRESWHVVLWLFGLSLPSWLRINSLKESQCAVVRFLDAFSYCQCFSIFLIVYSKQKPSNFCQEILSYVFAP